MTLLSICQDAASELGLRQPTSIVGSSDLTAQILYRLANASGKQLARYHDWQDLIVEKTFTTLAQIVQTDALDPDDYDRMAYNAEVWDRSQNLRYTGPTPQRIWQQLQTNVGPGGLIGWWRIKGAQLNIFPAPTAGNDLVFEYISKRWARSAADAEQVKFEADDDTTVLDEDLITLEMIWRFRHSRGFPQYAEDMATCEREKEKAAARDRGTGRIRPESSYMTEWPPYPTFAGTIEN